MTQQRLLDRLAPGRRARWAVGVVLFLVFAAGVLFSYELNQRYTWAHDTLDQIEPRYARLLGLQQQGEPIAEALGKSQAQLARYVYPESVSAERVGTDVQQRVRQMAELSGLSVVNSRIALGEVEGHLQSVSVTVTVQGSGERLRELLVALPGDEPVLRLESAQIQSARGRVRDDRITAQLSLVALRMNP